MRIAVVGELLGHPCPVDLTVGGVMEDVQPHRPPEELPHGAHTSKYRNPISRIDFWNPGERVSGGPFPPRPHQRGATVIDSPSNRNQALP